MALVIEDGSIVEGANSYVSETDLTQYAAARGITLVTDPLELIVKAMDYAESLTLLGIRSTPGQSLQFPREMMIVDGQLVSGVPAEFKKGVLATAVAVDQGLDPLDTIERTISSETVDVLSTTYSEKGPARDYAATVEAFFRKYTAWPGAGFTVCRGKK